MIKRANRVKAEKIQEQNLAGSQIETLDALRLDIEQFLKKQIEEEKRLEEIITEPLRDIINSFETKVSFFLSELKQKRESCESMETKAFEELEKTIKEINNLEHSINNEEMGNIYHTWLLSTHSKPLPQEEPVAETPELDIEALNTYAQDLKNLGVAGQMKVIVDAVLSAIQMDKQDPVIECAEKLLLRNDEIKMMNQSVLKAQAEIKDTIEKLEIMRKDIEKTSDAASSSLKKKKDIEKVIGIVNRNEELLKNAKEKLIFGTKSFNLIYSDFMRKEKDLNHEQILGAKVITDWIKTMQKCEKESNEFKKQLSRTKSSLEDYGKMLKKLNMQYPLKLKEFDKLDDKLQYMRNCLSQYISVTTPIPAIQKLCKVRVSIISAGKNQALPLPLISIFLFDSPNKIDSKEPFTGTKGYSISLKFDTATAEFNIWHLGCFDDAKSADSSYYQNVEFVLLVYELEENESETVENLNKCMEFLKDRTGAMIALAGITTSGFTEGETGSSDSGPVADYVKATAIPWRFVNLKESEEVKELFYGILYAKHPELNE